MMLACFFSQAHVLSDAEVDRIAIPDDGIDAYPCCFSRNMTVLCHEIIYAADAQGH